MPVPAWKPEHQDKEGDRIWVPAGMILPASAPDVSYGVWRKRRDTTSANPGYRANETIDDSMDGGLGWGGLIIDPTTGGYKPWFPEISDTAIVPDTGKGYAPLDEAYREDRGPGGRPLYDRRQDERWITPPGQEAPKGPDIVIINYDLMPQQTRQLEHLVM